MVVIGPEQFVTFRVQGDPAFAAADFRQLYLYVYDDSGNFGRWGAAVPATSGWQVRNHSAASIEKPWDSATLPDLSRIIRFAIHFADGQYPWGSIRSVPVAPFSMPTNAVLSFRFKGDPHLPPSSR